MSDENNVSLLIVDDEEEIREGICRSVSWAEHGIAVAGLAGNGMEALELIRELHPDLMLLDIRMPGMNGLELLEKAAQQELAVPRVIILSGYDDFYFCQKAIKQGASDYLLKPCPPAEILAAVVKLKEEVLAARAASAFQESLKMQFRENLELLREKLILYLIRTEQPSGEIGRQRWRLYEMDLPPENIGTGLIRIQHPKYSGEVLELSKLALRNLAAAILAQEPGINVFLCDYNDDLFILWEAGNVPRALFKERMAELRLAVAARLPFGVIIGIGETAATITELCFAYQTAFQAVEYSFWAGADQVLDHQEIETAESTEPLTSPAYPAAEEAVILQGLRTNDAGRIKTALENFFGALGRIRQAGDHPKQYVQRILTTLICAVYHVCAERNLDCDKAFGSDLKILDELRRLETLEAIKARLDEGFQLILAQTPVHKSSWKTVIRALQYMDEHYREELSLESVAQQVYVSPGYLSTLFKQELQKNFVDSLHEIRVAKAKELLCQARIKVYEVATAVGYHDEKYFSQIFKKMTGLTPNQYRETVARE